MNVMMASTLGQFRFGCCCRLSLCLRLSCHCESSDCFSSKTPAHQSAILQTRNLMWLYYQNTAIVTQKAFPAMQSMTTTGV